ncbi:MAG: OmpA family protein [Bacteroidales bacterium]|nr:OmpA family protein [Bacteroidales bacterium]
MDAPGYLYFSSGSLYRHSGLSNVRIAKGAVPLYDRLAAEGKIVTYAITFDTGKATIKPESMVEIVRVAKLMQEKPELSFEVQGHCDNTGSDSVNDPLSQKRAESIVAALVGQGISKDRLTAVGKGSHEPVADNGTDEGRAKNRRVEFVKK